MSGFRRIISEAPGLRSRRRLRAGALVLAVTSLLTGFGGDHALAQSEDSRKTPTMRQRVYDKLSKASELADKGDVAGAVDALASVEKFKDLSPYEKAQLYTAYGFIHFSMDDYEKSIASYSTVLEQEGLPEAMRASTMYTLAQIHFQVERYSESIEFLTQWIDEAASPGPEPYILLGQAYFELERYGEAIGPIDTAVRIAKERSRRVKESWYMLLRASCYVLKDYPRVIEVLEILAAEHPRKEYWVQLSAMYGEAGNERKQLAVYELAYLQGYLDEGGEIVLLSQLLLQGNVPHRAGVVLEKGLSDGLLEGTAEEYYLLSQAWTLAREDRRAIDALTRAAEMSTDGEFDARLAYAYANISEWERVSAAARTALTRGVEDESQIQVLLGMALFEQGSFDEAKEAFQVAISSPDTRKTASQWVDYIRSEQTRLSELERSFRP